MATVPIGSNSDQLFSSAVVTTDSTSFAFRSDGTKNEFNKLSTWLKGRIGAATFVLQTLKPGVLIEGDTEADWLNNTQDTITIPDEFRTEYIAGWQRYKITGVGADDSIVDALEDFGVKVQFHITAHGLVVGDKIVTTGFTPVEYNGTFTVQGVIDINNITVNLLSDPGGSATVIGTMASTVIEAFLRKDKN